MDFRFRAAHLADSMPNSDYYLYALHVGFWASFGLTRALLRGRATFSASTPREPMATKEATAPHSRSLVALHSLAFALLYFGMGSAIIPNRVPRSFPHHRFVGAAIIVAGTALMIWALLYFRSWRFRAKLEAGHELATGGPFRLLRHPIYMGLNLLAIGSAIWVPTPLLWAAVVLMLIGSDFRARGEEQVLLTAFGDAYREYCARTRRFVPGVY